MLTLDELKAIPLFSDLAGDDLERIAKEAADIHLVAGEYAVHEDEDRALFAVVSGRIEATKITDGIEQHVGWRGPGIIFGEVPITLGAKFPVAFRAAEPSRVLKLEARQYHALVADVPAIAEAVGAIAKERLGGLQGMAAKAPKVMATLIGEHYENRCHDLKRFLARNQVAFDYLTPDAPEVAARWPAERFDPADGPTLVLADGARLACPPLRVVADRLGLQTAGRAREYDTVIVGGGPAGLAAAVYGASEGLRTLVVEREAPGGQAGTSSRIENYLGFPNGVSGDELAMRALQQAKRLGTDLIVTRAVERIDPVTRTVVLDGGEALRTRTVILATGVAWRHLAIDGFDRLMGKGLYYGAARSEASNTQGQDIVLVGAGNSAGQAALFFANYASSVTMIVRGGDLAASMSHYLIEQVRTKPNVRVEFRSEVTAIHGDGHLTAIDVADRASGTTARRHCAALFIFIGADAETGWLPPEIARDARGYVLTGVDARKAGRWPRRRDPYLLETSVPGIFACGDVRASPVKRVAAAVGEGSMAIAFVHQFLEHDGDAA
ncbi:MAG: FAD-dependent oxidoreductase [Vicinamibacteria bacterium]|jgi:thioredoxin reductase (NADPH)